MRGAGCTVNDLWDRDIDKQVARTKSRYWSPLLAVLTGTILSYQLESYGVGVVLACVCPSTIICDLCPMIMTFVGHWHAVLFRRRRRSHGWRRSSVWFVIFYCPVIANANMVACSG